MAAFVGSWIFLVCMAKNARQLGDITIVRQPGDGESMAEGMRAESNIFYSRLLPYSLQRLIDAEVQERFPCAPDENMVFMPLCINADRN